jgi:ComF family protein
MKNPLVGVLRAAGELVLQVLAPPCCCICGRGLEAVSGIERFVCRPCWGNLPLAPPPAAVYNELLRSFPGDEMALSGAAALFAFAEGSDPMRLIYALKYYGAEALGRELGRVLGVMLPHLVPEPPEVLVPVPIHPARLRERGYNQAEAIARGIAEVCQLPVLSEALRRRIATRSQTQLTAEERRRNVRGAFAPGRQAARIHSRTLLLVDDVLTTGSTLNSCAETLLELGAQRVYAVAVVKAA